MTTDNQPFRYLRCRLGWHAPFPIGYGTVRCKRCLVAFSVNWHGGDLTRIRERYL